MIRMPMKFYISNPVILFVILLYTSVVFAAQESLSLELKEANLVDVIRIFAKSIDKNVIVSPHIHGIVTLQLHNADPSASLDALLVAHDLVKWRQGRIWFIAPRAEMLKHHQEALQWQTAVEDTVDLKTEVWQIRYAKAEDIARLLQSERDSLLSKRGRVRVDARTNVLCIYETPERIPALRALVKQLDVPVQQIVIEARLVSVDSDFERDLGIHFALNAPASTETSSVLNEKNMGYYSLALAKLADGTLLDVKLAALENAGHAELISSPRLFTANQQPASIEAGEEVPYQEVSPSGGTAVVF
jgi:type IV pilus assembly protein PilQ